MDKVYLYKGTGYGEAEMDVLAEQIFAPYGGAAALTEGKARVLVKPNLVTKKGIDTGATTHPAMLRAICKALLSAGKEVWVAESHGGTYGDGAVKGQFEACGVTAALKDLPVKLCTKAESAYIEAPEGKKAKRFEVIKPVTETDAIINLCKIKTHALTMFSGAAKNTFGTVPGLRKFELHACFPDYGDFTAMLNDLHLALPVVLNIADGILGMEGNGPTAGKPRAFGFVAVSKNAFLCDRVCLDLLGIDHPSVPQTVDAIGRGLCPETVGAEHTNLTGEEYEGLRVKELALPDSHPAGKVSLVQRVLDLGGGRFAKRLKPRPAVDKKKCAACGKCAEYCPVKTIEMRKGRPHIVRDKCITCFCCQELCPFKAIYIKKSRILGI